MPLATLAVVIAVFWVLLKGVATAGDFFVGLILASLMIIALKRTYGRQALFLRAKNIARYVYSFLIEVIKANIQVLLIVLSPRMNIRPGIIAYRTRLKTALGVTALANSITLTPGTLSVDLSEDASIIFVHTLDISNPDEVREGIRRGLEEPVRRAIE